MKRKEPLFWFGVFALCSVFALAIFVPLLGPSPFAQGTRFQGPGVGGLLGTDELGRDVLARLAKGAYFSLLVGVLVQTISLLVGIVVGVLGSFGHKWVRVILLRLTDGMFAFPDILLAILIIGLWGRGLTPVVVALSVTSWPLVTRLVVTQIASLKDREFVVAARAQGASVPYLVWQHILPQMWGTLAAVTTVNLAATILAEATLSFLGIGIQPPNPSWGDMINQARNHMSSHPILLLWPCLVLCITIFALNFIGDGLRARFDPRSR